MKLKKVLKKSKFTQKVTQKSNEFKKELKKVKSNGHLTKKNPNKFSKK